MKKEHFLRFNYSRRNHTGSGILQPMRKKRDYSPR
jgi:hypothetical protein